MSQRRERFSRSARHSSRALAMASVARRAAPPEASPYAQPHHFSLSANPDAPKTTEARRRRAAAEEVERCNAFIASRLEALKREPPSRFHAPDGDLSLKPKHKRGPKGPRAADRRKPAWDDGSSRPQSGVSADVRRRVAGTNASNASSISGSSGTPAGPAPRPISNKPPARRTWPVRLQPSVYPTPSERHEVEMQNANLRRRLANQYAAGRDSKLVREGKGRPVDGLAMWARRLAIYDKTQDLNDDQKKKKTSERRLRATPSSRGVDKHTGKCLRTGVPKTIGVARCSATGLYTYFAADGLRLKEHPDVPNLFYCEKWYDDFRRLDAKMQRQIVAWHASRAKGQETDPGFGGTTSVSKQGTEWKPVRPQGESWVVNRHMKLALTLMRRLAKGTEEGLTMRQVEERIEKCASLEKAEDAAKRARQKEIDAFAATERLAVRAVASTRVLSRDDEAAKVSEAPSFPAAGV